MAYNSYPTVTSLTGTSNQILVSSPVGNVTLSLPQSIHTAANVTFGTVNGVTLTSNPSGVLISGGTSPKSLTLSNSVILAGTDGSTLNFGSGGTLGTNAFSSASFVPTTRTINGLDLSTNRTLAPSDLGASTAGSALFTLTNPSAISYLKINADNTVTARTATQLKTDLSLTVGSDVQAFNANLSSLSSASSTNSLYYRNGAGAWVPVTIGGNISFSGGTLDSASGGGGTVTTTGTPSSGNLTKFNSALVITNANLAGDVTTSNSLTTTLANIPDGVPMAGSIIAASVLAPSAPGAGYGCIYVDSTSKNLSIKDDAGIVKHGVQSQTAATSIWIRGISDSGAITTSQPAFSDISGVTTNSQLPPILQSKTFDSSNLIVIKDSTNFKIVNSSDATKIAQFDVSNLSTGVTRTVNVPNANSTTVQPDTGTSTNFLTGITAQGVITKAQPAFTDVSGIATNSQVPATLSSKTLDNTNTITVKSGSLLLQDSTDTNKRAIFGLSSITTGQTRTINVANASSTTVVADTGSSNNFLTAISAAGVISKAQPSFTNISGTIDLGGSQVNGTISAARMPALLGDVNTSSGSLTTTLANIPTAVTAAGYIAFTAIAAPTSPTAGVGRIYVDSTSKNFSIKDENGVVKHGVQTQSATASIWIRGIADDGSLTTSQPAFTDISGTATNSQVPAILSSKTFDSSNVIVIKDSTNFKIVNSSDTTKIAQFDVSNIGAGATRTVNVPNAASTTVQPDTGSSNNFLTAISSQGVISKAQPAFSNLSGTIDAGGSQFSGTIAVGRMPALLGDVTSTSGSLTTTVANIPTAVTAGGYIAFTAIAVPTTPAAGVGRIYVDSTSKNMSIKDDAGVVKHGVQTLTAISNNWITAISDAGVVATAQPAFSNISGTTTNSQLPAILSSKTFDNTNTYNVKDDSFTIENATTGSKKAVFDLTNISASTTRTVNVPNANSTTVQAIGASATKFLTSISAQGAVGNAQPAFTDISGTATVAQGGTGSGTAAGARANLFSLTGNAGKTLIVNEAGTDVSAVAQFSKITKTTLTTPITGTSTYSTPSDVVALQVECIGGGAGGGPATGTAFTTAAVGGGGGSGGYSMKIITTPLSAYSYFVGPGGASGADGTWSWFGSTSTCRGNGGVAGTSSVAGTSIVIAEGGASGGNSGVGDIEAQGSDGFSGIRFSGTAGIGGAGGAAPHLSGTVSKVDSGNGGAGKRYGGGGMGGFSTSATTSLGGAGAQGVVIITEFRQASYDFAGG